MHSTQSKAPQEVLRLFRQILDETSKTFAVPKSRVTVVQFGAMSAGRLGIRSMARCGGFIALRDFVAPSTKSDKTKVKLLRKFLDG